MGNNAIKKDRMYTYADYLSWPGDERWEIIEGIAYMMVPPSTEHQRIVGKLYRRFGDFLDGKSCEPFIAPFGVTFDKAANDENITTVVEPDISIVCDKSKITKQGCKGAPDLIIEVLSPSTASYDVIKKRRLYEQNGVLEYWIIDPINQIVTRFYADDHVQEYTKAEYFSRDDMISPILFPELQIALKDIFPDTTEQYIL